MLVVGARPQIHRVDKKPALRARLHALRTAGCAEPGTMLRLPRAAHYLICESLCARDTARLSATASQWYRKDDPRYAALHACVADRVARAWGVAARQPSPTSPCSMRNVVPGKTMASMLKFLEAVEWPRVHGNGKIVEQIEYMPAFLGLRAVSVEDHEDIDGQVVARASYDRAPPRTQRASGIVAVAGQHITRIKLDSQPYYSVSYGTVMHEEKVPGGETIYYVKWPDMIGFKPCTMGETPEEVHDGDIWARGGFFIRGKILRRVVTKRPSWEPKPAWSPSTWKKIEERAKGLARLHREPRRLGL